MDLPWVSSQPAGSRRAESGAASWRYDTSGKPWRQREGVVSSYSDCGPTKGSIVLSWGSLSTITLSY
jgi:hypothetical protein